MKEQRHQNIIQEASEFASQYLSDNVEELDSKQIFPQDQWKKAGEYLFQGLLIDKSLGGKGFSAYETACALEGLGYGGANGGLNFAICAHLIACVSPIAEHGNKDQLEMLPDLCNGKIIAANAMTEPNAGSDLTDIQSTGEKIDSKYSLSGSKTYCSNAPIASKLLVYVKTDKEKGFIGGFSAFLVDAESKGIERSNRISKMGLSSCMMGSFKMDGVECSENQLVGKAGNGGIIFNRSMEFERSLIAALHLGTMKRIFRKTIEYAKSRQSGGKKLIEIQSISNKLANSRVIIENCENLVYNTAAQLDKSKYNSLNASMTKLYVSEAIQTVARDLLNVFGGSGYLSSNEISRSLRDAEAATIYSGTSDIQRNIITSNL